jgi:hypothetical protein
LIKDRLGSISGSSKFSGLDSLFEALFMVVDDEVDFFGDILLSAFFLKEEFFKIVRIILLSGVLDSHFKLFLFFFEFDMADTGKRFRDLEGFRNFLEKGLGLLLTGDFLMLVFFLHRILLKTFDNNAFRHK